MLFSRIAIAASVLVLFGLLSGISTWFGVATGTTKVSILSLLGAGLNIEAPSFFVLGVTVLAMGVWPRATSAAGYGILAWSLLIEFVGGIGALNRWLFDTSLFHQMSAAPAVSPNVTSDSIMILIGVIAALAGCVAFAHRDVQGR